LEDIKDKGPLEAIIYKYRVIKNADASVLDIPLCRLMPMEAARPIQQDAVDTLKKTFEESGFVKGHQAFYLSLSNENGE